MPIEPAPAFFEEDGHHISSHFPRTPAVPSTNDLGRGGVQSGDPAEPLNTGIVVELRRTRMVPGGMRGQATHGSGPAEASMNQERAVVFEKVNEPIEPMVGDIWQP
jgi:hypothetical protein